MVLGRALTDADGTRHAMAGLLPVETSFARRALSLGYRETQVVADGPLGRAGARFRGHEFHYATLLGGAAQTPLFRCHDARGETAGTVGSCAGSVMGSFLHLVDRAAETAG